MPNLFDGFICNWHIVTSMQKFSLHCQYVVDVIGPSEYFMLSEMNFTDLSFNYGPKMNISWDVLGGIILYTTQWMIVQLNYNDQNRFVADSHVVMFLLHGFGRPQSVHVDCVSILYILFASEICLKD